MKRISPALEAYAQNLLMLCFADRVIRPCHRAELMPGCASALAELPEQLNAMHLWPDLLWPWDTDAPGEVRSWVWHAQHV